MKDHVIYYNLKPCSSCGGEQEVIANRNWEEIVVECQKCGKQFKCLIGNKK